MKTLAKLLKEKNTLVSKISDIKRRIASENITVNENTRKWSILDEYRNLHKLTEELVQVKTKIAKLNSTVVDKIYKLSELKSLVAFFSTLDTREGTFNIGGHWSSPAVQEIRKAGLDDMFVRAEIERLTKEIDELQDELDTYNHTTTG